MGISRNIVILALWCSRISGLLAEVILTPGDVLKASGAGILRLGCQNDGLVPGSQVTTKWTLNNESITTGDRYSINTAGTLIIRNPDSSDAGLYMCKLVVNTSLEIEGTVTIFKTFAFGVVGDDIVLACNDSNATVLNTVWSKNGTILDETDSKYQQTNNGFLQILNLTMNDAGEYNCHADDEIEKNAISIWLVVVHIVKIIPEKTQLWLLEDSTLELNCIYKYSDSHDMETVDFYHDGKLITGGEDGFKKQMKKKVVESITTTTVTITKNGTTQTDQGVYMCELGTTKLNSIINIHIFSLTPKHTTLVEGDKPLEVACAVSGIGPQVQYEIEWHHDGKNLTEGDKYSMPPNGSLIINNPDRSDMGQYTCTFVFFPDSTTDIHRVTPAPVQVKAAPKIDANDNNKNMVQGDELELKCKVSGFPLPTITWLKDGVKFNQTQRIHFLPYEGVETGKLQIYSLDFDDQGTYTCLASNMVPPGNASAEMRLRVKDKLAALWPFLGIVAEVVILCAIILVYEKRRSKKLAEEDDATDGNNVDNTADHKDVRHRRT